MSDSDARLFAHLVGQILEDKLRRHEQVVSQMARSVNEGLQAMLDVEARISSRIDLLEERVIILERMSNGAHETAATPRNQ